MSEIEGRLWHECVIDLHRGVYAAALGDLREGARRLRRAGLLGAAAVLVRVLRGGR
jgi:hypothetical protein